MRVTVLRAYLADEFASAERDFAARPLLSLS